MEKGTKNIEWNLGSATLLIPTETLLPLIKDNFDSDGAYAASLLPPYIQFKNTAFVGDAVTSRGMFPDDMPELLSSDYSLMAYRAVLQNSDCSQQMNWNFSNQTKHNFSLLKRFLQSEKPNAFYTTDKEIGEFILNNAMTYNFWCMLQMKEKRRIGSVGYVKGALDIKGVFHEFNLQKFFPRYDEQKAYSVDENDFLYNASKEEVGKRLVEIMEDFKDTTRERGLNDVVTIGLGRKILDYAEKLEWDPRDFFKHSGSRISYYFPLPQQSKK